MLAILDSNKLSCINAKNESPKVQRWKLHCQEFDFKVEHIPGVDNVEADGFLRIMQPQVSEEESYLEIQALELSASQEEHVVNTVDYEKIQSVHGGVRGHLGSNKTIEGILKKYEMN